MFFVLVSVVRGEEKCEGLYGKGQNKFSLATGSPGELGLLKVLAEAFAASADASMCWRKAGSGESLKLLKEKQVDIIMVHAPAAEKKAIEEGWATKRILIGSNEFFIVGPPADPAKISEAKSAADAYSKIASARAKFFSRGDNSGTHKKEMEIWQKAGISPSGDWYVVTKDFMTATLKKANDEKGYFMTDSSTCMSSGKMGILREEIRGESRPRKPGGHCWVYLLAPQERCSFKSFATLQYCLSSLVVYIVRGHVAKGFVVSPRVVVGDKLRDFLSQAVGVLPDHEMHFFLAGSVIALDLSVGLRVIRRGKNMIQPLGL
jgi:tungstate transport system substrate-binding protein